MNEAMFVAELNSTLPLGFRALGVTYIDDTDKRSLMSLVKEAIYEIEIQNDGDINKLKELFSKDEILIEKETKDKKVKTINLKNYILDIDIKPAKEDKKLITVHGKAGSVDNLNPMYII